MYLESLTEGLLKILTEYSKVYYSPIEILLSICHPVYLCHLVRFVRQANLS